MTEYLVINKTELKVTKSGSLEAAAELAETTAEELSWSIRRTGRWDGENGEHAVIEADPELDEELDA